MLKIGHSLDLRKAKHTTTQHIYRYDSPRLYASFYPNLIKNTNYHAKNGKYSPYPSSSSASFGTKRSAAELMQ